MSNNKSIILILIVIAIILFFFFRKTTATEEPFISVRLYDANKNLIIPNSIYSIVEGIPGVYYIDLSVNVKNTGSIALTCDITSLTPTAFDSAITKTTKTVNPSLFVGWTSSLISTSQFEGIPTPDRFTATLTCKYTVGSETITLPPKSGFLDISILPDGTATGSFEVTLSRGGVPTEFCGDGICQASETATSCPQDCAVASYVKFRTSDLSYASGSAIAYTSTCGSILTAHGYLSRRSSGATTSCSAIMPGNTGNTYCGASAVLLFNVPGKLMTSSSESAVSLWKPTEADIICLCSTDGSYYKIQKYSTTSSYASEVNIQATSIDSSKEVAC